MRSGEVGGEERDVRAELERDLAEHLRRETRAPHLERRVHCRSRVRAATTQAGTDRDALVEMRDKRRHLLPERASSGAKRARDEISVRGAAGQTADREDVAALIVAQCD